LHYIQRKQEKEVGMANISLDLKTRVNILNSVLVKPAQKQAVEQELRAAKGDFSAASTALKDKLPLKTLQKLQVADLVVTAIGDQPQAAQAILGRSEIKTTRDLAKLNVESLTQLIAPEAGPRSKAYKEAGEQAVAINRQSFVREPVTVLRRMTSEGELPIADQKVRTGLNTLLKRIPVDTDLRATSVHKILN
jgi:hypothetical protein